MREDDILEDLEKCCKMRIWTRKSALIQPRASPAKSDGVVPRLRELREAVALGDGDTLHRQRRTAPQRFARVPADATASLGNSNETRTYRRSLKYS